MGKIGGIVEIAVGLSLIPLALIEPTPGGEVLVATLVIDGFRRVLK